MLFECMGICVLSPAHESEMRGYLVYLLIVEYLSIVFKFSHSRLDWTVLSWNVCVCRGGGGDFKKTLLEGSVGLIIYRDYVANRRSFIYCSLAFVARHVVGSGSPLMFEIPYGRNCHPRLYIPPPTTTLKAATTGFHNVRRSTPEVDTRSINYPKTSLPPPSPRAPASIEARLW